MSKSLKNVVAIRHALNHHTVCRRLAFCDICGMMVLVIGRTLWRKPSSPVWNGPSPQVVFECFTLREALEVFSKRTKILAIHKKKSA